MQKVELTYFKQSGKYYSEGELEVDARLYMHHIFDEVRRLLKARTLPGLVEGHSNYIVLVDVPGHVHNHPILIIEEE
jgi:hypothetical protein